MNTYTIRRADQNDLDALYALRTEAERWLADAGVEQWTPKWHDHSRRLIRESVDNGDTWVVDGDLGIVATARIAGADLDFWNADDDLESADHLYKLIVRRDQAGTGVAEAIMNWACERAERRGRLWLRIDIWRTNKSLRRYYEARGFSYVRTVVVPGRSSGLLLQRPAAVRTSTRVHLIEKVDSDDEEGAALLSR